MNRFTANNAHTGSSYMEIIEPVPKQTVFKSALFDFDGTLSLIREGWQDVMIPYFTDELINTPRPDGAGECAAEFIHELTGKQTIFQCMRLAEEVTSRGGIPMQPGEYKAEYLRRLMIHIKDRRAALEHGADPERYTLAGGLEFIKILSERNVRLYLASGTDEHDVAYEAGLLGIEKYFDGGIYGASDDDTNCSKELVIRGILADGRINADELVSFGDGYVEIELTKHAGGYPVAVASDEKAGRGVDHGKRGRLIRAGAKMVIADFSDAVGLCRALGLM